MPPLTKGKERGGTNMTIQQINLTTQNCLSISHITRITHSIFYCLRFLTLFLSVKVKYYTKIHEILLKGSFLGVAYKDSTSMISIDHKILL